MKRILTILLLTATLMALFSLDIAAKKDKKEKTASSERHMMTSDGPQSISGQHRFVIDGHVGLDIPDSCYNIYITDIDKEITSSDLVACVPVKNKQFHFETDLNTMKAGRIRAIMPGDNLCSAWIQIYFIPGFTVDMTVHNGYFDIHNEAEYKFMTNAWLNKDALAALFESMGAPRPQSSRSVGSIQELQSVLIPYQNLLSDLQEQMDELNNNRLPLIEEKEKLLKRMDGINAKMEAIIDKYANSLKY